LFSVGRFYGYDIHVKTEIKHYYLEDAHCVVIEVTGSFPTGDRELDEYYDSTYNLCVQHGTNRIVLDYRKLVYKQSVLQMVMGPERIVRSSLNDRRYYCAAIFDLKSKDYEHYKLFLAEIDTKIFLGKIKSKYKIFEDFDKAVAWIKTKPLDD